jgi:DNA mismatch repair protein MutL
MTDIIKLLPDSVANQIAAGEVVQRPASVVKELLENSVDAGATDIHLIIKHAGSTLVQVIDNGCGMSETDARMCFERHATSKIASSADLFSITTLGFRGEAMASIAAVSQVELRTRIASAELGTELLIEASHVKSQNPVSIPKGSSISVKNLFYNVPARRKFLKSSSVELRHIIDEFIRIALANNNIGMILTVDGKIIYQLFKSNSIQRIIAVLGKEFNERLLPVETSSNYVTIHGFVSRPEFARKNRNNQFFFVNNRFIKSPFLNHSIEKTYKDLLPESVYPAYCIFFQMAPEELDINIHPTKTEVKFTNEQMMYAYLSAAVKKSLGQFNITPSINFDDNPGFDIIPGQHRPAPPPVIRVNPNYNPFEKTDQQSSFKEISKNETNTVDYMDKLFGKPEELDALKQLKRETLPPIQHVISPNWDDLDENNNAILVYLQVGIHYIVTNVKSGLMMIHRQRALERIFFERILKKNHTDNNACQRLVFPKTVELSMSDKLKLNEMLPQLIDLGYDLAEFGQNTFIVHGIPASLAADTDLNELIHEIIDEDILNKDVVADNENKIALITAKKMAAQCTKKINDDEINSLVNELFATSLPNVAPDGTLIIKILTFEDIKQLF